MYFFRVCTFYWRELRHSTGFHRFKPDSPFPEGWSTITCEQAMAITLTSFDPGSQHIMCRRKTKARSVFAVYFLLVVAVKVNWISSFVGEKRITVCGQVWRF